MKVLTAKNAKYGFGRLIDLARSNPVAVSKHGRPVVVVMAVERFERMVDLSIAERRPGTALPRKKFQRPTGGA